MPSADERRDAAGTDRTGDGRTPAERRRLAVTTLDREVSDRRLTVEGAIPPWLEGSLLRTGPAKFEAGDRELRHWFDGLAMLHSFAVADGEVRYSNTFLESQAYQHVASEGDLGYSEFATDPCRDIFERFFSLFSREFTDNANVNVSKQAEAFVSMTEAPLPVEFDPETLETVGLADYEDDVDAHLTTAHPHHDDGDTYNYVTEFSRTSTYKVYRMPEGTREREVFATVDRRRPAYMHSFGLTENYVVLVEFPFVVDPLALRVRDRPIVENYRWQPERGARFLLVDRETGDVVTDPVTDAFFAFHHVNAFEESGGRRPSDSRAEAGEFGEVIVDVVAYDDPSIVEAFYLDDVRSPDFAMEGGTLRRYRVGENGVESERLSDAPIELPRINYDACNTRPYRYVYGLGNRQDPADDIWNRLVKVDVADGTETVWAESGTYPGEPVFVAAPDAADEDEGVVLSVVLDAEDRRSFLLVLDAAGFAELGRATVDHHIPLGLHGGFYDV